MHIKKLALVALIGIIVSIYFIGGGEKYLNIHLYQDIYDHSPLITALVFFLVFFIGTSASLPVAGILSVTSGVIFGTLTGFLISLTAVTLGGTIAFISTRFLFHDLIERRFSTQFEVINKGIEKEGALYLFGLRMIPVIPFVLLNLLMGLTSMRTHVFMLATLLGMIPVLVVLSYTGSQLGEIESFSMAAIFTPGLILSLTLLASFPILAKLIVGYVRRFAGKRGN